MNSWYAGSRMPFHPPPFTSGRSVACSLDVADLVAEVTDDKSLPKAKRKRLQIETAPEKSARAQTIKIADKISNLRDILYSPPADWDYNRRREYFAWAKSPRLLNRSNSAALRARYLPI